MKPNIKAFQIPVMVLFLIVFFLTPSFAMTTTDTLIITESFDGLATVEFTVDTTYDDLIGFAAGNNYDFNFAKTTLAGWKGVVAVKHASLGWSIPEFTFEAGNPYPISVNYNPLPSGFNLSDLNDDRAFLFYSENGTTPLSTGYTEGFFGLAFAPASSFVAFRANGDTITGETSMVPIPGAGILLFSGLISIVSLRRKK